MGDLFLLAIRCVWRLHSVGASWDVVATLLAIFPCGLPYACHSKIKEETCMPAWSVHARTQHVSTGLPQPSPSDPRPAHHGKLLAFNARLSHRLSARPPADTVDMPTRETHQDAARPRLRDAPPRAHAAPPDVEARAEGQVAAEEE
eukprot:scaffold128323_cov63-Phaeocystis_antarctica.AAC.1